MNACGILQNVVISSGKWYFIEPWLSFGGLEARQLKTYNTDKLVMIEVVIVNVYPNYILLGLST